MPHYVLASRKQRHLQPVGVAGGTIPFSRALSTLEGRASVTSATGTEESDADRHVAVFEGEPQAAEDLQEEVGEGYIVEPVILHQPSVWPLRLHTAWNPFAAVAVAETAGAGSTLQVTVRGASGPLVGCELVLYLRNGVRSRTLEGVTDGSGEASFDHSPTWQPSTLLVLPPGGHWAMVYRGPRDPFDADVPPLPLDGALGWWHGRVGVTERDPNAGAGVRVGVVDTGVRPHGHLDHVTDIGAFVDNDHDPSGHDVDSHGSHVCGTIGARPGSNDSGYDGVAPGVDLFSARVFRDAKSGANQGDIARAIDALVADHSVDLINMSLGSPQKSEIVEDAVLAAADEGALCLCAAGNSNGPVEYPGRLAASVAVGALGLEGWGPPGSLTSMRHPDQAERYGDDSLYHADFSCFGDGLDCCAPGVGIIATVPERHGLQTPAGGMDGTSMASPVACAALARALASSEYTSMVRDVDRAEWARRALYGLCVDVGLPPTYQGRGMVKLA